MKWLAVILVLSFSLIFLSVTEALPAQGPRSLVGGDPNVMNAVCCQLRLPCCVGGDPNVNSRMNAVCCRLHLPCCVG